MPKVLPSILLLALGACAPSRWDKPGANAAAVARDQAECRNAARDMAFRTYSQPPRQPFAGAVGPSPYIGMRADPENMWQYSSADPGPYAMEERLTSNCLRERGYHRVPAEQRS